MSVCVHVCPFLSKNQQKKNNSVLLNPPCWLLYPYCNVYSPLSCVMLAFWRSLGYKTSLLTIPPTSCPDVNLASLCRLSGLTGHSRCTLPCSAGTFIVFGNNNMSNDTRYSQPFRQTDKKKTGWVWEESGRKHVTLKLTLFSPVFHTYVAIQTKILSFGETTTYREIFVRSAINHSLFNTLNKLFLWFCTPLQAF